MRLADTPAPLRAAGQADAAPAGQNRASAAGCGDSARPHDSGSGDPVFDAAVAALQAGRDAVASARDDLELESWPAPKRLAPHAAALAVTAYRDGEEAGEGKLMLLYDPAGQDGWTGTFRIVAQVPASDPTVPSLTPVFPGANFPERESYDLFGIGFDGHPDLTRILMG